MHVLFCYLLLITFQVSLNQILHRYRDNNDFSRRTLFGSTVHDFNSERTTYPGEYSKACGTKWQEKYINLHKAIRDGKIERKFIIAVPVHVGLADLLLGYVSSFLVALLSNSAFLIADVQFWDNTTRNVEFGYHSPFIDWSLPPLNSSLLDCMMPPYPERINCPNENVNVTIPPSKDPLSVALIRGVNGGIRSDLTKGRSEKVFFISQNRGVTFDVFHNEEYHKRLREIGMNERNIFSCLFNFLFKINDDVCTGECEKTLKALRIQERDNKGIVRIGLQVRYNFYLPDIMNCTDSLIAKYQREGKTVILLLVSGEFDIQENAKKKYGDMLLLPTGNPVKPTHVHDRDTHTQRTTEEKRASDKLAVKESARDFYLLSLTDIQVVSFDSGFGTMGSVIRPSNHRIMYKRPSTKDGTPPQQPECAAEPAGQPLIDFAHAWSGLRGRY